MPRRAITRPKPMSKPVNAERLKTLTKLLSYHERKMHKWKSKLVRAVHEFDKAFKNTNRLKKELEAEHGHV